MKSFRFAALFAMTITTAYAFASEPTLTVQWEGGQKTFSRAELQNSPHAKRIQLKSDPAYGGKSREVLAIPAEDVFNVIPKDAIAADSTLNFKCLDGFSAALDQSKVLNTTPDAAKAWIAIEEQGKPWNELKAGNPATAGPFYLVWTDPEKSQIGQEQWPFQLSSFEVKPSLAKLFPQILPNPDLKPSHAIQKGYLVFTKNCFACHTLNLQGTSEMGPDLNVPYNPTEYLKDEFLKKLIRNPQTLRSWPQSKMSAFPPAQLSDKDMGYLLQYLKHMKTRKIRAPRS